MIITKKYMTPPFAEELGALMGCQSEYEILPGPQFVQEALKPVPVYFETEERTLQGVCCVCYKKGVLGKCSNAECGLLMHYTCVPIVHPGDGQLGPVCNYEQHLLEQANAPDMPYWHEAEVVAKLG